MRLRNTIVCILILLYCCFFSVQSQSIIAGQYSENDNYTDFEPDSLINCAFQYGCNDLVYLFDMDGDGSDDLKFYLQVHSGGMGGDHYQIKVKPLNNNQLILGKTDSCEGIMNCAGMFFYYDLIKGTHEGDTLNNSSTWYSNNWLYIISKEGLGLCMHIDSCTFNISTSASAIIGTRIIKEQDTLYGWIRLNQLQATFSYSGFAIEDYALNKKTSFNIGEHSYPRFKVYPNPATSEITITGIEGIIEEISIYSKLGQKVIHARKPPKTIDVSSLSRGLYIVEVRWDGHRIREKFIVQ